MGNINIVRSSNEPAIKFNSVDSYVCNIHGIQGDNWLLINQSRFCVDCLEELLLSKLTILTKSPDQQLEEELLCP